MFRRCGLASSDRRHAACQKCRAGRPISGLCVLARIGARENIELMIENLLPIFLRDAGPEQNRQSPVERGGAALVADIVEIAFDLSSYRLLIFRLGVGDPFDEVGELVDALRSGPQPDPIFAGVWRGIRAMRRIVVLRRSC